MTELKVVGVIRSISEVQSGVSGAGKEWKKLTFILDTDDKYNNVYNLEVFGAEKVENFLKYNKEGSAVKVNFNVKTSEWKDKFYTTLDAWKVFKADESTEVNSADDKGGLPF